MATTNERQRRSGARVMPHKTAGEVVLHVGKDIQLNSTGLMVEGELDYEEWFAIGQRLGEVSRAMPWWIGDWLRFGIRRWGEKYTDAQALTGYSRQTLVGYTWVAQHVPPERRHVGLTFSHHAYVASLPPKEQQKWLDKAEKGDWTVERLRTTVREAKTVESDEERTPPAPEPHVIITCPHCHNPIDLDEIEEDD